MKKFLLILSLLLLIVVIRVDGFESRNRFYTPTGHEEDDGFGAINEINLYI